ncbi:hypothetical protein PPSIR1_08212 [Plesiocystis pacifica SIR-1]|uniref:Cytochrome c domain-containing protein n=1 Tax=Plesiocystis pacifica SIR-1 TaxID=391625 RepID=A6GE17_9BACT|nr:hypothetical protein [Plesiocystis pacifica]EDM75883.1 hypothetical protein PPSIR1_08212 [Plesiocystis pacifica SIR-1]
MKSSLPSPLTLVTLFALSLASTACKPATSDPQESDAEASTYYRDVQPIIAAECGGCHQAGGLGPMELSTYEQLVNFAELVDESIRAGSMPPWQPDPDCRSFAGERRMSEEDKQTVLTWIEQGMAEGDPADATPVEPPTLELEGVTEVVWSAQPYTPDASTPDDYHCLVMDIDFADETYLTGYQVVPGDPAVVHHIIFYLVPPSGADSLLAADAASPEPGYACFGSSGHGGQPMGVWAPGGLPVQFPDDSAFVVEPGSKLVAQMHYFTGGGVASPDDSQLQLATRAEAPGLRVSMPLLSGFFDIPADDPAYTVEFSLEIDDPQTKQIFSVMPHMHLLGRRIDLHRERDGEQTCIARIDDWDFDWQQFYDLELGDFVEVRAGDTLRYSCTFDNSAANQPIVDGEQRTPGPVAVGEGTLDEMCLHVVAMVEPYVEAEPTAACPGMLECAEQSCQPEDGLCFLDCSEQEPSACGDCLLPALNGCGQAFCPDEADAVVGCLALNCEADFTDVAAVRDCLAGVCAAEFQASWACYSPHLYAGECDAQFGPCGLEF